MDLPLDISKIMEYLPHRYPFLLVDRVLSFESKERIVGIKNVTINEPFFQGHFPGHPIMPGVLIVEAMAQVGGILAFLSHPEEKPGSVIYFTGIDKVRFRRPVVPGDQIVFEVEFLKIRSRVVKMAAKALVDNNLAAEAELMASFGVKSMIHPTAIIDPKAEIASDVEIGPYTVIHGDVVIGSGTTIGSHVVIEPYVSIGPDCRIFQYAAIGAVPQSFKFEGKKTYVKINRGTTIREFVTIHRGTGFGGGLTEIGEACFLMAYAHVAHDCRIGRQVIMANNATLAGHINIGDYATVGAFVAIHQFVQVGEYAFIGGASAVPKDVPPYVMAAGNKSVLHGLNSVGLKRHGFSANTISMLKKTYRLVFRIGLTQAEAVARVRAEVDQIPEVVNFIEFITSSQRGVTR